MCMCTVYRKGGMVDVAVVPTFGTKVALYVKQEPHLKPSQPSL